MIFNLSIEKMKENRWNTTVSVCLILLILFSIVHSFIEWSMYISIAFFVVVVSLQMIVILSIIINVLFLLVHIIKKDWDRLTATFLLIIASIILWIAAIGIDVQTAFLA